MQHRTNSIGVYEVHGSFFSDKRRKRQLTAHPFFHEKKTNSDFPLLIHPSKASTLQRIKTAGASVLVKIEWVSDSECASRQKDRRQRWQLSCIVWRAPLLKQCEGGWWGRNSISYPMPHHYRMVLVFGRGAGNNSIIFFCFRFGDWLDYDRGVKAKFNGNGINYSRQTSIDLLSFN